MERSIWKIMVRSETLPFNAYADATSGQLVWVFANTELDWRERRGRIHPQCLKKFDEEICEVCYRPLTGLQLVPEHLKDEVYVPGEGEIDLE